LRWLKDVRAVIFDMDGLLLDTELVAKITWCEAAGMLGFDLSEELFLSLVGLNNRDTDARLAAAFGPRYECAVFRSACARHMHAYLERNGVPLKRGAVELLAWLAAENVPVALATSSDRRDAEVYLRRAGLLPHFRAMVTGEQVTKGKPDPEIYLSAAAALRIEPRDCLALEDSFPGVRAARAAGMPVFMVPDLIPPTEEIRALASDVFPSLTDVLERLRQERRNA
jgi:HAD superfamily hydrolase (TIGR01509 family)